MYKYNCICKFFDPMQKKGGFGKCRLNGRPCSLKSPWMKKMCKLSIAIHTYIIYIYMKGGV